MGANAIRNRSAPGQRRHAWTPYVDDAPSIAKYGARPLDVDRVVPDFANWSALILADRADAGLAVTLGEVRPYSQAELAALLAIGATGPQVVRVADDEHGDAGRRRVGIIGTRRRMTPAGWSFRYVTMIPRADWDAVQPPPVQPPIPPPDPCHTETRTYVGLSDALLALTRAAPSTAPARRPRCRSASGRAGPTALLQLAGDPLGEVRADPCRRRCSLPRRRRSGSASAARRRSRCGASRATGRPAVLELAGLGQRGRLAGTHDDERAARSARTLPTGQNVDKAIEIDAHRPRLGAERRSAAPRRRSAA